MIIRSISRSVLSVQNYPQFDSPVAVTTNPLHFVVVLLVVARDAGVELVADGAHHLVPPAAARPLAAPHAAALAARLAAPAPLGQAPAHPLLLDHLAVVNLLTQGRFLVTIFRLGITFELSGVTDDVIEEILFCESLRW